MRPSRSDPIERVIARLLGRGYGSWPRRSEWRGRWDAEKGKLVRVLPSLHRTPRGVRYNRFMRLRRRISGDEVERFRVRP